MDLDAPPRETTHDGLRPAMGLASTTLLIIGSMVGSGIFFVPAAMVVLVGSAPLVLLAFLAGGLLSLAGALVFSELAAAYPRAGGQAVYIREAFGRFPAFLFTWSSFAGIQSATVAAIAVAFAQTLDHLATLPGTATHLGILTLPKWGVGFVAVGLIWLLTAVNYLGVRRGAFFNNLATAGKLVGLAFVVVAAFFLGDGVGNFAGGLTWPAGGLAAFGLALAAGLFAYDGWVQPAFVASEVRDARRNVPRAILLGVGSVTVLYMLVAAAYFHVLPTDSMSADTAVAEDTVRITAGAGAALLVAIAILVSTAGATNAYVLSSPRIFYDEAREGAFPRPFGLLSRFRTPGYGLVYHAIWASLLALSGTFDQLALLTVFMVYAFYLLTALGHLRLRRRDPAAFLWFRMPLWPLPSVVFIIVAAAIIVNFFVADFATVVRAAVLVGLGGLVYLAIGASRRQAA